MARAVLRDIVFGLAVTGLLVGCVEGGGKTGDAGGTRVTASPGKKAGATDVEAPEVFQATDSALWDGRPSLGGIWVASPDVTNPERVVMFNPATGKSITGALFKRERDNPGPRLQLSSDAAEALGILAGQPTEIRVTALRKEEKAETAAAPAATDTAAADPTAKEGDAAAIASAALDAVDAGKPAGETGTKGAAKPGDAKAAAAAAGTAAVVAEGAADGAAVVDETPKKKTWKERRAEAKAAREAKKKAAAEAKAAAAAAAAGTAVAVEGEAPTTTPDAAAAAVAPIESAPLDARKPEAVAPAGTKKTKPKVVGDSAAAAPAAVAAAPEATAATGPARPIQVASFSKEDNANRAAQALAKIGVTATPQKSEKAGKAVWGVVVMGDEAMLKKIKDAGFADAYFLK
ncbi:MAG: SPOR domain-containing protein [Tabrizicola sp.]|nr:SPOR domain-containing protein [Tabrizicola sp.]